MLSSATFSLDKPLLIAKIQGLEKVATHLKALQAPDEKVIYLKSHPKVKHFFSNNKLLFQYVQSFELQLQFILFSLIVIDQVEHLFPTSEPALIQDIEKLKELLQSLAPANQFFDSVGGLVGYQLEALKLLREHKEEEKTFAIPTYYEPPLAVDVTESTEYLAKMILQGIRSIEHLAEIYPIGGAADRLNLQDEKTFDDLPAARLEFLGHTLIEGLIRDLQGREYLYYKLFHQSIEVPVALMTSFEKDNHRLIQELLEQHGFFGRSKESFYLFSQPLVPTFSLDAKWNLKQPWQLLLKPGGHGAIWKMCADGQVFSWLKQKGSTKAIIRQINNPIAGVDHGLLSLAGIGDFYQKSFGFSSCLRKVQSHEGMNVVKREILNNQETVTLTNIEYCDFKKYGIEDIPQKDGGMHSRFPSNTNVLFADLEAVEKATQVVPYPGSLINFKNMKCWDPREGDKTEDVARIELLMQSIADAFSKEASESITHPLALPSFITFNHRCKTISTTKKQFVPGSGLVETAVGCYYDYLKNGEDLLKNYCQIETPLFPNEEEFLQQGPSFIFKYHPSLGPLYEVIGQKIQKGSIEYKSEMQFEIADLEIKNLTLDGSLIIKASQVMGQNHEKLLQYSHHTGRCSLKNVTIVNQGVDRKADHIFWKNKIDRKEAFQLTLEGTSEFEAHDVTFNGQFILTVPHGKKVIARMIDGSVCLEYSDLPSELAIFWKYSLTDSSRILLSRSE